MMSIESYYRNNNLRIRFQTLKSFEKTATMYNFKFTGGTKFDFF